MRQIAGVFALSVTALICASLGLACRTRPQVVTAPVGPPAVPESLIQEYVSQGDRWFEGMHLYAWRRAEEAYARAFYLAPRNEIREKLAQVKLFRMTREVDEDIVCPDMEDAVRFICKEPAGARGQALCDLARGYAAGPPAAAQELKRLNPSALQVDSSPTDAYLFALYAKTFGSDAKDDDLLKAMAKKFMDSPLFVYLSVGASAGGLSRATQQFPEFAEAWELSAEISFQRNAIKHARAAFSQALTLIPDYSRARNGLANIYFFTLEDFQNALKTYEMTLESDPQNTAALFGKGAALHHLDRYDDSNAVMDLMLAGDLSRRGRVGTDSVQYYRGEAYYYRAYNYHLLKDDARARELIDVAKRTLPAADEINYLSGLLYYNAGELDAAKADLEKSAKLGKNCYAYHYLGMIDLKTGGPTASSHFLTCAACLERGLRSLQDNIRALSGLDVEPIEKEAFKTRLEMKLVSYRDTSAGLILRMIGLTRDSPVEDKWKSAYMDAMNDLLGKVQAISLR